MPDGRASSLQVRHLLNTPQPFAADWIADRGKAREAALPQLLAIDLEKTPDSGKPLPFDLTRAHQLYQALFGQVEDLIKGKHLLIVPSGP